VGPNNSGKTNLLRSVLLFFTGYENAMAYRRSVDLTFGAGNQRTSLTASIALDASSPDDLEAIGLLDELHSIVGTAREAERMNINLYFTGSNDTPVYRVFGNQKIPAEGAPAFSRKQKQLVELVLRRFRCHYVPSAKSISNLYSDLLQPFLTEAAYRAIEPHMDAVRHELEAVSDSLNAELTAVGLDTIHATFGLESDSPSRMLTGFDLMLSDPGMTALTEKGQGIQSTALFASFVWITERERAHGLIPIWLIEEPESYLHPELEKACQRLLGNLAEKSTVLLTTHSLGFVPGDVAIVQGVDLDNGRTAVSNFESHQAATGRIRHSLGIEFSDYYNLGRTNIFMEGPSDVAMVQWAIAILDPQGEAFPLVREALIQDFGGVSQLEGFLKAVFEFIHAERALVAVFDGDAAGNKSRRALQQYLAAKEIQFQPNREFVSVRAGFAIEALFPDEWIVDLQADHMSWFEEFSVDASGTLEPFRIKDRNKSNAQGVLRARAEDSGDTAWATRWLDVVQAIESSLARQVELLEVIGRIAPKAPFRARVESA
jgi:predicted ATP-dependent endonuclease of OLD family